MQENPKELRQQPGGGRSHPAAEPAAPLLRACRRLPVDRIPVWFMRQAGRFMADYRKIRARHSLLEICRAPELAAEVTLQPVRRFDLDAAIIFADILLPLPPLGAPFGFVKGRGPIIAEPIRSAAQIEKLHTFDPEKELAPVMEAIGRVRESLPRQKALIGFAGGPFTVASYMIEGGSSRNFVHAKCLMYQQPEAWRALMEKITTVTLAYLQGQVRAGADVIQLFDSWVGCLGPDDYRSFVFPYSRRILQGVKSLGVPCIHFGTGTATLLEWMRAAGADVVGVDWRIPIDDAFKRLGPETAVQGNLDPVALLGPKKLLLEKVEEILHRVGGRPGFIFNLGHGILPQTPEENIQIVVASLRAYSG